MRILVVDDNALNRNAAVEQLGHHELTVVDSYVEAMKLLAPAMDEQDRMSIRGQLKEEFGHEYPPARSRRKMELELQFRQSPQFDVVLTDMMMPVMEDGTLRRGIIRHGEEAPYGLAIALKAALSGVKHVAMATNTNHHEGAMSAALDHFQGGEYGAPIPNFLINGAAAVFVHAPLGDGIPAGKEPCFACRGSGAGSAGPCRTCDGTGERDALFYPKDWAAILEGIMGPVVSPPSE